MTFVVHDIYTHIYSIIHVATHVLCIHILYMQCMYVCICEEVCVHTLHCVSTANRTEDTLHAYMTCVSPL